MEEELRAMKLQQIEKMIQNNIDFQLFVNKKKDKLSKSSILEYLDTTFNGLDTFLNIYFDFVSFLSPEQFQEFEKYREKKHNPNRLPS